MSRNASTSIRRVMRVLSAAVLLAVVAPGTRADAAESYSITGADVALYNIAGAVQLEAGSGSAVTVQLARSGRDAAQLRVQTGTIGSRQTLRVIYPSDHIVYRPIGASTHTNVRVREDGTFGDDSDFAEKHGDRRISISSSGGGLEAWADLTIRVPKGQKLTMRLGAGAMTATNVDGHILLDTSSGPVMAHGARGWLSIDTGSGDVVVKDAQGDVLVDTGSGEVQLIGMRGGIASLDTGSGRVAVTDVKLNELKVDTGSGDVDLNSIQSPVVAVDTGSGGIEVDMASDVQTLEVDSGSGDVSVTLPKSAGAEFRVESSSGDIEITVPHEMTRSASDEARGRIGDGRGTIHIDTGSGNVQIRPRTSAGASLDLGVGAFMNRTFE